MLKFLPIFVALIGLAGIFAANQFDAAAQAQKFRVVAPNSAHDGVTIPNPPTPTPEPPVYQGDVIAITLPSAKLTGNSVVERRDTRPVLDREQLEDPSHPSRIAWYDRFAQPGSRATNSMFAAHVDYVNYGRGPFADLTSAQVGDTLTVLMDNGAEYYYSVQSVQVIHLNDLNMNDVVYPPLTSNRERVTLISCGGTFVGGEYNSRVILVAEREIAY